MSNRDTINSEAWDILNEDEQAALSLSLGHGKSTWEAGEILNKAHFKYLEIQKRARKFLEIFTNHLEKYGGLFPEELYFSFAFKEYLTLTIIERRNISQSVKQMEDPSYSLASKRKKLIISELTKLQETNTDAARDFYSLIMDFDRWNNFRILPLEAQEPSAFKRRNKARNVKHLKNITSLPQYSVLKIIERYAYSGRYPKLYLPLVSGFLDEDYKLMSVRDKPKTINDVTGIGLFIFQDRAIAEEFAKLVSNYFINATKNCKTGQKFWPEFRILMTKAINYKELEHIHKSRTYLDNALFDSDKKKVKNRKSKSGRSKKSKQGEDRVDNNDFFYPEG